MCKITPGWTTLPDDFDVTHSFGLISKSFLSKVSHEGILRAWSWRLELKWTCDSIDLVLGVCCNNEKILLFEPSEKQHDSAKAIEKAFFFNYGALLAQSLCDKVLWQIKEFFNIELDMPNHIEVKPIIKYLNENDCGKLLSLLNDYKESEEYKFIEDRANPIKHSIFHQPSV